MRLKTGGPTKLERDRTGVNIGGQNLTADSSVRYSRLP
jgi:hypothetical protein